jgi:hypothetical protein
LESVKLDGIRPGDPEPPTGNTWSTKTDFNGEITITLETPDLDHGPSFDVRADFMPANERYHVDVLLDRQTLERESPPYLLAQSKLIQDYHWSHGSSINEDRGRAVYRTTLTVFNGDNTVLADARLELYATAPMEIEVAGQKYTLSQENSHHFHADAEGELTFVVQADDLRPASISVWAGFMNPQVRYTINPADEAHEHLSQVQAGEMVDGNRMKQWKKPGPGLDENGNPVDNCVRGPFLKPEHHKYKQQVAGAVRHVMSAGRSAPPPAPQAMRAMHPMGAAPDKPPAEVTPPRPSFDDMTQRPLTPRGDTIRALPTLRHINRSTPITPESVLHSMRHEPGALGFEFELTDNVLNFRYLKTHAEVEAALKKQTATRAVEAEDQPLGNIFEDAWDHVKSAAEEAFDQAKRIAVVVGDAVKVVIEKADSIVHMAVRSIVEAVLTVVEFLKKLALELIELIKFLLMMFDFAAILAAHDILIHLFEKMPPFLRRTVGDGKPVRDAMAKLLEAAGLAPGSIEGESASPIEVRQMDAAPPHPAEAHANSVGARSMYSKFKDHQDGLTVSGDVRLPLTGSGGDLIEGVVAFIGGLLEILPRLPSMSPSDAGNAMLDLLRKAGGAIVSGVGSAIEGVMKVAAAVMEQVLGALDREIYIPFISALYEWITGHPLTLLSLFCLLMGVVVHITYLLLTGNEFGYDRVAKALPDRLVAAPPMRAMAAADAMDAGVLGDASPAPAVDTARPLGYGYRDNHQMEALYVTLKTLNTATIGATDALFAAAVPRVPSPFPIRDQFKIVRGLMGMGATTLMFLFSTPCYVWRVRREVPPPSDFPTASDMLMDRYFEIKNIAIFCFGIAGDLLTVAGGAYGLCTATLESFFPDVFPAAHKKPGSLDEIETLVLVLRAVGLAALIPYQAVEYHKGGEHSDSVSHNLRMASKLFFIRDLFDHISKMPGFLYTITVGSVVPKPVYYVMVPLRLSANVAGLSCHGAGEFTYLEH